MKRPRPRVLLLSLCLLVAAGLCAAYLMAPEANTTSAHAPKPWLLRAHIVTDNYANQHLTYHYFVPSTLDRTQTATADLLVIMTGTGADPKWALNTWPQFRRYAEDHGVVLLAPWFRFDEDFFDTQTSYQYPWAWSGAAMLRIIEKIATDEDLRFSRRHFLGFSAGAQFAQRFCVWNPESCSASADHAGGERAYLDKSITPRFFVTVGTRDEPYRRARAAEFRDEAMRLGVDITYREYDVPHKLTTAQINDSLRFFQGELVGDDE